MVYSVLAISHRLLQANNSLLPRLQNVKALLTDDNSQTNKISSCYSALRSIHKFAAILVWENANILSASFVLSFYDFQYEVPHLGTYKVLYLPPTTYIWGRGANPPTVSKVRLDLININYYIE